jgi:hypothetical protein
LTGLNFREWSDNLRDVEEMLDLQELKNQLSEVRDRAQAVRREFQNEGQMPKWDMVNLEIVGPLVDIKTRVEEEIAKREMKQTLTQIDRDPVPQGFSHLVRKYYERLGQKEE